MPASQVNVTTAATLLAAADQGSVIVRNRGTVAVYIGLSNTVTSATGFQIDAGEALAVDRGGSNPTAVYGIAASGTQAVHVLSSAL